LFYACRDAAVRFSRLSAFTAQNIGSLHRRLSPTLHLVHQLDHLRIGRSRVDFDERLLEVPRGGPLGHVDSPWSHLERLVEAHPTRSDVRLGVAESGCVYELREQSVRRTVV